MATYSGRKTTIAAFMQAFGNLVGLVDQASVTAVLTTADKVRAIRVPAGTMLTSLRFFFGDLDTGTGTLTVNVGWESCSGSSITVTNAAGTSTSAASDATAFGSALTDFAVASAAGGTSKTLGFEPITFNDDVYITLVPAVSGNAMAATKTVTTIAEGIALGTK
jgi:hypothetical protein